MILGECPYCKSEETISVDMYSQRQILFVKYLCNVCNKIHEVKFVAIIRFDEDGNLI